MCNQFYNNTSVLSAEHLIANALGRLTTYRKQGNVYH